MTNTHYLSIIRKSDFIDLFKYGHRYIFDKTAFSGDIKAHANDQELFDRLTCNMNLFEYYFEYVLIHYIAQEHSEYCVDLQHVQAIYTFNEEAKKEMSISFDPRIQIQISPWTTKFEQLQHKLFIKQSLRGVDNLWSIFGLEKEDRTKCEEIITNDIVSEVFRQLYAYERPKGDHPIWTYLLRYERHSFYPQNYKGIFYDIIHITSNWMGKQEIKEEDAAEKTDLYKQLNEAQTRNFDELNKIVIDSKLNEITEKETNCKFTTAAFLFLFLKKEFRDGVYTKPDKERIKRLKEVGGFEFSIAVFLLGITLGYDKTYDAFYDVVELPILKKRVDKEKELNDNSTITSKINGEVEDATCKDRFPNKCNEMDNQITETVQDNEKQDDNLNNKTDSNATQSCLFQEEPTELKPPPRAWMRLKKGILEPANTDSEIKELESKGYKIAEKLTTNDKKIIKSKGYNIK